jgi:hydroxyacylglutathione hydrolase
MFQRFFDEGLAQASFLLACDRTRRAVIVDPRRDAAIYVTAARQHDLTIVAAIETHVHADFVSGSHELSTTGVRVITGPDAGLAFDHHEAAHDERLELGDLSLTFLHTPGHTPEHICILAAHPGEPTRLFTGDLLFVGAVGRPDLLGAGQTDQLANQLYGSLTRVMSLDDDVEVHPGHGAGSLCGAGIGKEPCSTIGRERRTNPMLRYGDRGSFVSAVLADLPETPAYFRRMKRVNAAGPPVLQLLEHARTVPPIAPTAAAALSADGAILIDLRDGAAFTEAHPYGAVNLGFGSKVGYWAGWVLPPDSPLLLMADEPAHVQEAATQLLRVGLDRLEGYVAGGFTAWRSAGLPTSSLTELTAADLRARLAQGDPVRLIDVRTPREWRAGHIESAVNIPVGDLPDHLQDVVRDGSMVGTICEGGYRSTLAASLLAREGITPLVNISGGMAAYRALEVT